VTPSFCRTFGRLRPSSAGNSGSAGGIAGLQELKQTPLLMFQEKRQLGNQDHIPADYLNGNLRVKASLLAACGSSGAFVSREGMFTSAS